MKRTLHLIPLVLFILLASGCATVSTSGNYTLWSGNTLRGDLYITSGNATLEEGSYVTGSVIMTSGNLNVNGEIDGDIILTSGNVILGSTAIVHGDIRGTSDDISQAEGSRVEGQIMMNQSDFTFGSQLVLGLLFRCCLLPLLLLGLLIFLLVFFFRRRKVVSSPAAPPDQGETPAPTPADLKDPKEKLTRLKEMLNEGLITEAEYESKKAEILAEM